MNKTAKVIRDILLIVAVIIVAVVVRMLVIHKDASSDRTLDLGNDITADATKPPHGMDPAAPGHGRGNAIFPEDTPGTFATVWGQEISNAEVNKKANMGSGQMDHALDQTEDQPEVKDKLRVDAFAMLMTDKLYMVKAPELGIDLDAFSKKVMDAWAAVGGYDSPEAKLASIGTSGYTIDDIRRLQVKETLPEEVFKVVTAPFGDKTDEEKKKFFTDWLVKELTTAEVTFTDANMKSLWDANKQAMFTRAEEEVPADAGMMPSSPHGEMSPDPHG